ncbi:MAG: cytidine/deoxycytidylate deaminase family protein [Planctomycetota bacterium]
MTAARKRVTMEEAYLRMAVILASRSTCLRVGSDGLVKRVGCVVTNSRLDNVLSVGYNGNARGLPDRCDAPEKPGGCGCLHAEANAISKCLAPDQDKVAFITDSPCETCAKLIINSGFSRVLYIREYRITTGVDLLHQTGIHVKKISLKGADILAKLSNEFPGW